MEDFPVNMTMKPPMPMMSGMMGGMMGGMTPQPTSNYHATYATELLAKMPALPPAQISTVMNPPPRPAGFHPPQAHKPIPPKGMPANVKTLMATAHKAPVKSTLSNPSTTVSKSSTLTPPPTVTGSSSSMVLPLAGGLVVLLFFIMRR